MFQWIAALDRTKWKSLHECPMFHIETKGDDDGGGGGGGDDDDDDKWTGPWGDKYLDAGDHYFSLSKDPAG